MEPTELLAGLGSAAVQTYLIAVITDILKDLLFPADSPDRAKWARLIALLVGGAVGFVSTGLTGKHPGEAVALGLLCGVAAVTTYPVVRPTLDRALSRREPPEGQP